jgi:hypothetical protein
MENLMRRYGWIFIIVLSIAMLACSPPVIDSHALDYDTHARQSEVQDCYVLNDTSASLQLLNPDQVEVHHFTNTSIAPKSEVLDILFIFTNHTGAPIPEESVYSTEFGMTEFGDLFFKNPSGTRAFFEESSFGSLSITGTAVGWMDFTDSSTGNLSLNGGGFLSLAQQYVDIAEYDLLALVSTDSGPFISGSGLAVDCIELNGVQLPFQGLTYFNKPRAVDTYPSVNTSGIYAVLPDSLYAHEITHALGINGHALALDAGASIWDPSATLVPYGDSFDIQGDRVFSAHHGVWHKYLLGWIDSKQVPIVSKSSTFVLHPLEEPKGKVYGLVIPLSTTISLDSGAEYDKVIVEYRTPVGFDSRITNIQDFNHTWGLDPGVDTNGVYIKLGYANTSHSTVLLNTHPLDPYDVDGYSPHGTRGNTGRNAHAMLNVGETFVLPDGSGSITVTGYKGIHMPGNLGYPNNTLQGIEVEVTLN